VFTNATYEPPRGSAWTALDLSNNTREWASFHLGIAREAVKRHNGRIDVAVPTTGDIFVKCDFASRSGEGIPCLDAE